MARALIGTSGWSYKHWEKGMFYPAELAPRAYLPFYATHFATVDSAEPSTPTTARPVHDALTDTTELLGPVSDKDGARHQPQDQQGGGQA